MYTIDEIITSINEKPFRTGFQDSESDTVDARTYLRQTLQTSHVRSATTVVPLSALRILQPNIEMWRYLRLCKLSPQDFLALSSRQPLELVRGHGIHGYPLLQGNHRALYALIHGIEELPARINILVEEEASFAFTCSAQVQYENLDIMFGRHDAGALKEAYKRLLSKVVNFHKRKALFMHGQPLFTTRTALYRQLRDENEVISERIPCISLEGYVQTVKKMFHIKRTSLRLSTEIIFFRGLMLTQHGFEASKLKRIRNNKKLLNAPILIARTKQIDFVIVGHTRMRAHVEEGRSSCEAICIHVEDDNFNRFLDTQASGSGYLSGNEGVRHMEIIH